MGGGGKGACGGGGKAARDEANAKALDVLTAEQKDMFEKMQGAKVSIDPAQLFRGGGGGKGGKAAQPDA
jgi:hypothetical protein